MDKKKTYLIIFLFGAIAIFIAAFGSQNFSSRLFLAGKGGSGGDIVAPNVTITSPQDDTAVNRSQATTITASASDDIGVASVSFYVSNKKKCTDATAPYACDWSVPGASGKSYSIQARAYDATGNVGYSNIVTVTSQ